MKNSVFCVAMAVMAVLVLLYFTLFKGRLLRCGDENRHYGTMVNLWLQQSIDDHLSKCFSQGFFPL